MRADVSCFRHTLHRLKQWYGVESDVPELKQLGQDIKDGRVQIKRSARGKDGQRVVTVPFHGKDVQLVVKASGVLVTALHPRAHPTRR